MRGYHIRWNITCSQRRLGHHSPVLTQEIYTHLMRERYDEGRKAMETYIRQVMDQPD